MYLLDQSDSWQFYQTEICSHGPDGRSSVASGLKELEEAGYLKRTWVRDEKGKYTGRIWEVYEDPTAVEINEADISKEKEELPKTPIIPRFYPDAENLISGNPISVFPMSGNLQLTIINITIITITREKKKKRAWRP